MACFSATQLHALSWTSSLNPNFSFPAPKLFYYPKPLRASFTSSNVEPTTETKVSSAAKLRELCRGHVPDHVIRRAEEVGYVIPTEVQRQALPFLFSGRDCVLHAQTGSGKTLAYLLQVLSAVDSQRAAVQALIVVPTRELGMQVTKVARMLAANPSECDSGLKLCTVMGLLDGGMLKRHKSWLKAEPPTIVVATIGSLSQMLEKHILKLDSCQVLVVDEVDFMFNSSKEVSSLKRLLTSYSSSKNRQTIFASASIPQHRRFLYDCMQQKWTRADVVHVHVNSVEPMPSCLHHRFVVCNKKEKNPMLLSLLQRDSPESAIIFVSEQDLCTNIRKNQTFKEKPVMCQLTRLKTLTCSQTKIMADSGESLCSNESNIGFFSFLVCNKREKNPMLLSLLQSDSPESAIIFVSEQSEKSKKAGTAPPTTLLVDFLRSSCGRFSDVSLLEEDMNFNRRAASLSELRGGGGYLLVATDIAARGVDLPETTHIYNFDIPKNAVNYLHRAGRTGRKPFSDKKCFVTSIITVEERFVLQRFENELMFCCEQLFI